MSQNINRTQLKVKSITVRSMIDVVAATLSLLLLMGELISGCKSNRSEIETYIMEKLPNQCRKLHSQGSKLHNANTIIHIEEY